MYRKYIKTKKYTLNWTFGDLPLWPHGTVKLLMHQHPSWSSCSSPRQYNWCRKWNQIKKYPFFRSDRTSSIGAEWNWVTRLRHWLLMEFPNLSPLMSFEENILARCQQRLQRCIHSGPTGPCGLALLGFHLSLFHSSFPTIPIN